MFRNNIKISLRSLLKNRSFTLINTAGLALGIGVFILIMEYVAFEWSYNRFHKNFDQLYRASIFHDKDNIGDYFLAPGIAPEIKKNFPGVVAIIRFAEGLGNGVVSSPQNQSNNGSKNFFKEANISFADDNFFKVFSFPVVAGDGSLKHAQVVAISQSTAKKYFGSLNAIGKVLTINNQFGTTDYTVTTVFEDIPEASDIKADILLSLKTLESKAFRNQNDWADPTGTGSGYAFIYLVLNKGVDPTSLSNNLTSFLHKLIPDNKDDRVGLQPMSNLHLASTFSYNYQTYGNIVLVVSLFSIAVLILIVAWVNYVNLSAAKVLDRAKEVGMRKILGARKRQIISLQFTETCIILFLSTLVALFIVKLIQPFYNSFTGHALSVFVLSDGWFWLIVCFAIFIVTAFAGGYVSAILSSFNPLKTIRGTAAVKISGISLRKSLLVFQFAVSVLFIVGTIILYRQLHFMQNQDLGFKPTALMAISGPDLKQYATPAQSQAFKNELYGLSYVKKIAASNNIPGRGYNFSTQGITRLSPKQGDEKKSYNMLIVDDQYFDTYSIAVTSGATFTPLMINQGWRKIKKVIINEAAVTQLGFKSDEQAVGQKIKWDGDYEIVGVAKNYHHMSLHMLIEPIIFLPAQSNGYFTIKLSSGNINEKISQIHTAYQKAFSGEPFTYSFVDNIFDRQYQDEYKMGQLFVSSAVVAIFIACLGLFGISAYSARQRAKEIGIRKILGANIVAITAILSKDFLKLVIIAVLIASPLAWLIAQRWLQSFAYHINVQWWIFLAAGFLISLIALITISFQSIRAALANPVDSLRSE